MNENSETNRAALPSVTRWQALRRGAVGECPNCGQRTLFVPGRLFKVNPTCPNCGLRFEKGEGTFLGPLVVNYAVTVFGFVVPMGIWYACGGMSATMALSIVGAGALLLPLAFYRLSWGWWLAVYYFFLSENLPANLRGGQDSDE